MSLHELRELAVNGQPESSKREALMRLLEQIVEECECAGIRGAIWVGGSFMSTDPEPADIDIALCEPADAVRKRSDSQANLLDRLNEGRIPNCDSYLISAVLPTDLGYKAYIDIVNKFRSSRSGKPRGVARIFLSTTDRRQG